MKMMKAETFTMDMMMIGIMTVWKVEELKMMIDRIQ